MPKSPEQIEQIRTEKKKLIMDTALKLFAEKGFHATSISQITQKAGISKGLVYNYFESKQSILEEITNTALQEFTKSFDLDKNGILDMDEFVYFIRQSFRMMKENIEFWQLYFALMLQPRIHESFSEEYQKMAHPIVEQIYNFLKNNGSKDPEGDMMVISALMEGAFLYVIVATDFFPVDVLEEKVVQACIKLISN